MTGVLGIRVATAAVALPLFLAIIWAGGLGFTALVAALALLAFYEYARLGQAAGLQVPAVGGALVAAALVAIPGLGGPGHPGSGALLAAALFGALCLPALAPGRFRAPDGLAAAAGVLYTGWLLSHWPLLRGMTAPAGAGAWLGQPVAGGFWYLMYAFICTWATDTGAYFAGRAFGRHKLAPAVSPKKTWEGAAGGTVLGAAAGWALAPAVALAGAQGVLLGLLVAVAGQVADLAESALKRYAGVKDSGTLLPGHGGILDRFDSALFTVPLVYYAVVFLGR